MSDIYLHKSTRPMHSWLGPAWAHSCSILNSITIIHWFQVLLTSKCYCLCHTIVLSGVCQWYMWWLICTVLLFAYKLITRLYTCICTMTLKKIFRHAWLSMEFQSLIVSTTLTTNRICFYYKMFIWVILYH